MTISLSVIQSPLFYRAVHLKNNLPSTRQWAAGRAGGSRSRGPECADQCRTQDRRGRVRAPAPVSPAGRGRPFTPCKVRPSPWALHPCMRPSPQLWAAGWQSSFSSSDSFPNDKMTKRVMLLLLWGRKKPSPHFLNPTCSGLLLSGITITNDLQALG